MDENPGEQPTRDELQREAQIHILKEIIESSHAPYTLALAEAFAWVRYPNQPHGGSSSVSVSK